MSFYTPFCHISGEFVQIAAHSYFDIYQQDVSFISLSPEWRPPVLTLFNFNMHPQTEFLIADTVTRLLQLRGAIPDCQL